MPRDMVAPKNLSLTRKSVKSLQRSCPATFSTKIHVLLAKHMKLKVSYIYMYVHIALALWEKNVWHSELDCHNKTKN